jgi:HSP20 family protein
MNETKEIATTKKTEAQTRPDGQAKQDEELALRPRVDIYEDAQGISLHADLPGVSSERLNLQVDKETLTISGDANIETPQAIEPLYAEVRSRRYQRAFTLSAELDTDNISAELKDGVLKVNIPKRAEVRPRKIAVRRS